MRTDDLVYLSLRKFPFLTHLKVEATNKHVSAVRCLEVLIV